MSTGTIIFLGAISGATIFLGLPIARLKNVSPSLRGFLSMLATGVLLYLLVDVTAKMRDPVEQALAALRTRSGHTAVAFGQLALLIVGVGLGLVGIVYMSRYLRRYMDAPHNAPAGQVPALAPPSVAMASVAATRLGATRAKPKVVTPPPVTTSAAMTLPTNELAPQSLSLIIAAGIGMHNLSEGLAIGQSAASGALQLATILIVGFGLHNMTEGFGIAGPLSGKMVSWKFLGLLGLVGGGPTFLGTILGISFHSTALFIFCLAFAAGAIIYVVMELLGMAKRYKTEVVVWGLLLGFLLGYSTDLILSLAGA